MIASKQQNNLTKIAKETKKKRNKQKTNIETNKETNKQTKMKSYNNSYNWRIFRLANFFKMCVCVCQGSDQSRKRKSLRGKTTSIIQA